MQYRTKKEYRNCNDRMTVGPHKRITMIIARREQTETRPSLLLPSQETSRSARRVKIMIGRDRTARRITKLLSASPSPLHAEARPKIRLLPRLRGAFDPSAYGAESKSHAA